MRSPNELLSYATHRGPQKLVDVWSMSRGTVTIRCGLTTHPAGWVLRLTAGDNSFRSQVCETEQAVRETSDGWRAEAAAKGWV